MNQILICGGNRPSVMEVVDFLRESGKFGVQHFSHGLDMVAGIISAMHPELLIVNITDMMDSAYTTLMKIQADEPRLKILAMGSAIDYNTFNNKFFGNTVNQLPLPFQKKEGLAVITRALGIPFSEVSDILPVEGNAVFSSMGSANSKPTVLLVDDNAMTLRSMKGLLEDDFQVMIANSGKKAFIMIEKQIPDIILLDYEMPEMDGREVLQKLRLDINTISIPVIFLTGVNDREHISAALALRPSGYLLKPVAKAKLLATIDQALEQSRLMAEASSELPMDFPF